MNILVSDPVQQQETLSSIAESMRQTALSVKESQEIYQKHVDKFLDFILDTKSRMASIAVSVNKLTEGLSELTWFTETSPLLLEQIKALVESTDKLANDMVRTYAKINRCFHKHGIDKTELRQYKEAANSIKEMSVDLNDRFFVLPQDSEFMDLMQQLHDAA